MTLVRHKLKPKKQFYIYVHCRPATTQHQYGEPFYVGKGHNTKRNRGRAYYFKGDGNKHYDHVVVKHGKENILIYTRNCVSEQQAHEHEVWMIAHIGRRDKGLGTLVNMTDGGDGASGYKHTPEFRVAQSKRVRASMTPERRASISERMSASMTPEVRVALAEKSRAWWTPERRAAQSEKMFGKRITPLGYKPTPEKCAAHAEFMRGKKYALGAIHLPWTPEHRAAQAERMRGGKSNTGHIWITDGVITKMIKGKIPRGWKKGRIL